MVLESVRFILLQVVDQFSQHHLVKEVVFFPLHILASSWTDLFDIKQFIEECLL